MKQATYLITAAMLLALTAAPALALPFAAAAQPLPVPETSETMDVIEVQGSCYAVGQQVAQQYGGTLANVRMENRGGRTVCVGEVIVQNPGERGRKIPFEVPLQ
jgi:hypothetical protein